MMAPSPAEPPPKRDSGPLTGAAVARRSLAWLQVILGVMSFGIALCVLFIAFGFGISYIFTQFEGGSWVAFVKIPAAALGLALAVVPVWALWRSLDGTFQVASGQVPADSWRKAVNPWLILPILIMAYVVAAQFSHLIRMSNEGATRGNLGAIRSALSLYYRDTEGRYPAELSALAHDGKYLQRLLPSKSSRYHPDSSRVRLMTSLQYAAGEFDDSGGWAYVVSGSSAGLVMVNCTHTDSKGSAWSSY